MLLTAALTLSVNAAQVILSPTDSINVSDETTTTVLGTVDPGTITGSYVVRSRANTTGEDSLQIVSYLQFDLSGLTPAQVNDVSFSAEFQIDFVSEINTTGNTLPVRLGRNTQGAWDSGGSNNPLFDDAWVDEPTPTLVADDLGLLTDVGVTTPTLTDLTIDVTSVVQDWVNGVNPNHGFVLYSPVNSFQGGGFDNAELVMEVIPEPSSVLLALGGFALLLRRRR